MTPLGVIAGGVARLLAGGLFPANFFATQQKLFIGGRPATPLAIRLPMQLFWIAALYSA